uniref:Probable serine/threonine-protein kinase 2 n=1 Tax=Dermatophagoides pteronyssinus TaxID=6956 RepID=A0A6P6YJ37_DERPT
VLTGERLAAKAVEKCSLSRANGFNEIKILHAISHPSVGRFYEAFCNNQTIMILTEYYYGGGLNSYINRFSRLREDCARTALYKLLQALLVIQRYHVLHRDLKNDNIMLKNADDPTSVVIIDFGLSSHLYSKQITMRCGSPGFVAPEVLTDRPLTDMKSDVFSLGVIFFTMLTGKEPFSAKNNEMTLRRNAKCEVQFTEPVFDTLSEKCKSMLAWLLQRNPEKKTQ